jgi:hypothetical protein
MKQTNTTSLKKSGKEALVSDSPRTLLHVDLWTDIPSSDVSSARSGEINVLPSALAMVGDLLAVAGGEFRTSSATSLSAWFGDTLQAVNAARHLQRLVKGFSRASIDGPLYACFTLTSGSDPDITDDATLLTSIDALRQTPSEEVLFAGSICEAATVIPGLQFKVPAAVLAKKTDTPQPTILQLLPPTHMEGFVDEPIELRVRSEDKVPVAPGSPPIGAQSLIYAEPSLTQKETPQPASATTGETAASSITQLFQKITPHWVIITVSTVVVLASILIFSPIFKSSPHPTPQPAASGNEKPTAPPPPIPKPAGPIVVDRPAPTSKPNDSTHTRAGKEAAPEEPKPVRGSRAVTFSPAEIDLLIARADKDTGDGNYDRAIKEYNTVLNQDPSNALAKKGLAKAIHNKNQN